MNFFLVYLEVNKGRVNSFPFVICTGDGTINFEEFVNMIEEQNNIEEDENLFTIFGVFDPEDRGYIEGESIKKSLLSLTDAPVEEINEILQAAQITDGRKIGMEGAFHWVKVKPRFFNCHMALKGQYHIFFRVLNSTR